MKKIEDYLSLFIAIVLLAIMMWGRLSYAQLVSDENSKDTNSILVSDDESSLSLKTKGESKNQEETDGNLLSSSTKTVSHVEKMYDSNHDGILQDEEIKEFLNEVVLAVERTGSYYVSSKILMKFDDNKNKRISVTEISDIKKLIEESEDKE